MRVPTGRATIGVRAEERRALLSDLDVSGTDDAPFCVGGTLVDSHASLDPAMEPYALVDRTITCTDGTVRVGFTPPKGSWTIVSGTGAFEGLRGSGEMEVTEGADNEAPGHETFTGTVTR